MKDGKNRGSGRSPARLSLLLPAAILVTLYLANGDSSTLWAVRSLLHGGWDASLALLLLPLALGFGLQFFLSRSPGKGWTAGIPGGIAALLLCAGEGCWAEHSWSGRILGGALWFGAAFFFLGAVLAAVLETLLRQNGRVKAGAAAAALALLALGSWLWPKNLGGKLELDPGSEYIWYFKGEAPERVAVRRDGEELLSDLRHLKVLPALRRPENLLYGSKLCRLNGDFLLVAKDRGSSYIYRWSGPPEEFQGDGSPLWRTLSDSAVHSAIY